MGQPFGAQNYALCFIIICLFIYTARCRNVQGVQQYGTLIPKAKFLKMRPSYDNRGSSSRNQFSFPKPIGSKFLAIGMHLFRMSYRGFT